MSSSEEDCTGEYEWSDGEFDEFAEYDKDIEGYAPTVLPHPKFNPQTDCETLRKAMKGLGSDKAAMIDVLCHRSCEQRIEIAKTYKQMFAKDLAKEVISESGGKLRKVFKRLLKKKTVLEAYELHRAIRGAGTDEETLIEVICTSSDEWLKEVKKKYQKMYGKDLEKDVSGDTSGDFRRMLVALLNCHRPPGEDEPNIEEARKDAQTLYEAGEKKHGTDESRFINVFCSRSYPQLEAIFDVYAKEYKKDIEDVIKSEFSGDIAKGLTAVVGIVRDPPAYFAKRFHKAMTGLGTNDKLLIQLITVHCDLDLAAIKAEYKKMYGKSLSKAVHSETSGDYRKALLELIGPDD